MTVPDSPPVSTADRWRRLCAPELIFCFSAAAALSPYLMWYFGGKPPLVQRMSLTYTPALIWGCGLVAFLLGARIAHRFKAPKPVFRLSPRNLPINFILYVGVAVVLVQLYFAVRDVYGSIPLIDYFSGDGGLDVGTANEQQQYSGFGQLGLLTASLYCLNPLIVLSVVQWVTRRRGSRLLTVIAILMASFAHLLNAKRQGLYSAIFYSVVGFSIYFGNPVPALARLLPLRPSKGLAKLCLIAGALALVLAFGYIASIRTQGRVEASTAQIFAYLEYPLVNFEAQCAAADVGPGEFKLLGPFRNLVPYKYEIPDAFPEAIPKRILSAPSGMYELIHWSWGLGGVLLYSAVLGFVARWFYDRARFSVAYLLSYCYLAVALVMAHSNNQILILSYGPLPLLWVYFLRFIVLSETSSPDRVRIPANKYGSPVLAR